MKTIIPQEFMPDTEVAIELTDDWQSVTGKIINIPVGMIAEMFLESGEIILIGGRGRTCALPSEFIAGRNYQKEAWQLRK